MLRKAESASGQPSKQSFLLLQGNAGPPGSAGEGGRDGPDGGNGDPGPAGQPGAPGAIVSAQLSPI